MYGLTVPLDCHYVELMSVLHTNLLERVVHEHVAGVADFLVVDGVVVVHFDTQEHEFSVVAEFPKLPHPGELAGVGNLA